MKAKIEFLQIIHYKSKVRAVKDDFVDYRSCVEHIYNLDEYTNIPLNVRNFIEINQANKNIEEVNTENVYSICTEYYEKVETTP